MHKKSPPTRSSQLKGYFVKAISKMNFPGSLTSWIRNIIPIIFWFIYSSHTVSQLGHLSTFLYPPSSHYVFQEIRSCDSSMTRTLPCPLSDYTSYRWALRNPQICLSISPHLSQPSTISRSLPSLDMSFIILKKPLCKVLFQNSFNFHPKFPNFHWIHLTPSDVIPTVSHHSMGLITEILNLAGNYQSANLFGIQPTDPMTHFQDTTTFPRLHHNYSSQLFQFKFQSSDPNKQSPQSDRSPQFPCIRSQRSGRPFPEPQRGKPKIPPPNLPQSSQPPASLACRMNTRISPLCISDPVKVLVEPLYCKLHQFNLFCKLQSLPFFELQEFSIFCVVTSTSSSLPEMVKSKTVKSNNSYPPSLPTFELPENFKRQDTFWNDPPTFFSILVSRGPSETVLHRQDLLEKEFPKEIHLCNAEMQLGTIFPGIYSMRVKSVISKNFQLRLFSVQVSWSQSKTHPPTPSNSLSTPSSNLPSTTSSCPDIESADRDCRLPRRGFSGVTHNGLSPGRAQKHTPSAGLSDPAQFGSPLHCLLTLFCILLNYPLFSLIPVCLVAPLLARIVQSIEALTALMLKVHSPAPGSNGGSA